MVADDGFQPGVVRNIRAVDWNIGVVVTDRPSPTSRPNNRLPATSCQRRRTVAMNAGRFEKIEGTDFELPCELVLLAMGFVGPERSGLLEQLGVEINERGNVGRDACFATSLDRVFVCGDVATSAYDLATQQAPFLPARGSAGKGNVNLAAPPTERPLAEAWADLQQRQPS